MGSEARHSGGEGSDQAAAAPRKLPPGPGLAAQEVADHQLAGIHDATIQIVAEQGYRALKVRDVVRRAEISTRAFYEHFGSKEDCFLQTYDLISRRATRRIIAAQTGERDWRRRSQLVFEEFVKELEAKPEGARLALIEAYTAGEAALARAWRAERAFEDMFAEALARAPKGVAVPPLIVQGMVAGVATVSRNRMLSGRIADLANSGGELLEWAMCYPNPAASELSGLDTHSVWGDTTLEPQTGGLSSYRGQRLPSIGDRALILTAVANLAATNGYGGLTAPRIRSVAKVSRRNFDAHFDGVEDCYLAAIEDRTAEAMARAARAQAAANTQTGGVYRAIAALSNYIAGDQLLSRVCLADDIPPGLPGLRSRQRLIDATLELLAGHPSSTLRPTRLITEASAGAVWSLFHHHVTRNRALRQEISATLTYVAMAPLVGADATITAISKRAKPVITMSKGENRNFLTIS